MNESMVTARMDAEKKAHGGRILKRSGLTASQCINMLYDRIIQDGNADFLMDSKPFDSGASCERAADFVDALSAPRQTRFDTMSKAEIRMSRLSDRGLV